MNPKNIMLSEISQSQNYTVRFHLHNYLEQTNKQEVE
jgi:hypothetical protein